MFLQLTKHWKEIMHIFYFIEYELKNKPNWHTNFKQKVSIVTNHERVQHERIMLLIFNMCEVKYKMITAMHR